MPGSEVTGLIALSGPPPLGRALLGGRRGSPPVCRVSPLHRNAEGIKYLFFVSGLGFVCVSEEGASCHTPPWNQRGQPGGLCAPGP